MSEDARLLERIRSGEPGAFEAFVSAHGDRIYAFGRRVCGPSEDARDIVQDTLLQAFLSLKDLKRPEALRTWLYRVAANACRMKRRRGGYESTREVSFDDLAPRGGGPVAEIPDPQEPPDETADRAEMRARVQEAIRDLPASHRIVLVLRDMEQLTTEETAEALELPITTVKMRLHRARLMVRQRLEIAMAQNGEHP